MSDNTDKDTIYIDAEDDITIIIDKVRASDAKVVALVLPKRASALQSVVNLKLLKRKASEAKKNPVLITSDAGLLPIAGMVGLHVAKTLQSKPAIPDAPSMTDSAITVDDESEDVPDEPLDRHAPIGQLAGHVASEETIELDNDDLDAIDKPAKGGKKSINKKLKIPDFNRFRLMLFGGAGLLILLIVGSIFAFVILPKAHITIKTDSASISTDLIITAKTDAKDVNNEQLIVPAISKQVKKTDSEKTPATGQRDDGTKSKGTMTLTNCINDGQSRTVPAGTGFSSGSFIFTTDSAVTLDPALYSGSTCKSATFGLSKSVPVTAAQAGDKYNLSARSYTAPANLSTSNGSVLASGSAMSGGTSKLVQAVSQTDIDNAKQKVLDRLNTVALAELKTQFTTDNALPLTDTLAAGGPVVTSSPNVNEAGSEVSVSVTVTFTQLGVKNDDVKQLVENEIKKHIDSSKQVIQDNGIGKAAIVIVEKKSASEVKFNIKTVASAGPQLDGDGIKQQIAGKKKSETERLINSRPGFKEVNITYSPFWVYSTPKNKSHITITFDQNNVAP